MNITPTERRALAIAFITGHANAEQQLQYRALFAEDAEFRDAVQELSLWLAPLNADVEDVAPAPDLLDAIYADIDAFESAAAENVKTAAMARPTGDADIIPLHPIAANDRGNAGMWKALTAGFAAVAALAIGSHFVTFDDTPGETEIQPVAQAPASLLTVLQDSTPSGLVAILYDPIAGNVVARFENIETPTDGDFELWRIRAGDGTPVSLGLLDASDGGFSLSVQDALQSGADTLAISLEKPGGSTSGAPEGPVLYTGVVQPI